MKARSGPSGGPPGPLPAELEGLVEKCWLLSGEDCDGRGRFEVVPDSHFGIGVVLEGDRCWLTVGGPITERIKPHVGDSEIFWLRFRPGKLPRIADLEPRDLVDKPGLRLDRIHGFDIDELGERMSEAGCARERLRILGSHFQALGSAPLCQDRRCARILEAVDALDGRLGVGDLAREFGMSVRTVQRLVGEQVGLTPKQLILNTRLQRTIARLRARPQGERLADVASECGFADQSHLIRDFRRLANRLPSAF